MNGKIEEYEFSDTDLKIGELTDSEINLNMDLFECRGYFYLSREDSQAIAAHFNHDLVSTVNTLIDNVNWNKLRVEGKTQPLLGFVNKLQAIIDGKEG